MPDKEPWSIQSELHSAKYAEVPLAEMLTAGADMASIVNTPMPMNTPLDAANAMGAWMQLFDGNELSRAPSGIERTDSSIPPLDESPAQLANFSTYVDSISPHWIAFQRSQQTNQQRAFQSTRHQPRTPPQQESSQERQSEDPGQYSQSGVNGKQVSGEPLQKVLQVVAPVFVSSDFQLEDPHTFRRAVPSADDDEREAVLEELSRQLDVVETCIEEEVAQQSQAFLYAAMTIGCLGVSVGDLVAHTDGAKSNLAALNVDSREQAGSSEHLCKRRMRLESMCQIATLVADIESNNTAVATLIKDGEFTAASEVLSHLQALQSGPQFPKLRCLEHLPQSVQEHKNAMLKSMLQAMSQAAEMKQMDAVLAKICRTLRETCSTEAELSSRVFPDEAENSFYLDCGVGKPPVCDADGALPPIWELVQAALWPVLPNLQSQKQVKVGMHHYKDGAVSSMKSSMRELTESCVSILLNSSNSSTATPPDTLTFEEQLQWLMPSAFAALLQALRQLLLVHVWFHTGVAHVTESVLLASKVPASEATAASKQVHVAVQAVINTFQGRWAKLLSSRFARDLAAFARPNGSASMGTPPPTLSTFSAVSQLSQSIERTASAHGRPATELRITLRGLCQQLLEGRSAALLKQLQVSLDMESWQATTIPPQVQSIVDLIIADDSSPAHLSEVPSTTNEKEARTPAEAPPSTTGELNENPQLRLSIGDDTFIVVNATVLLLRHIATLMKFGQVFEDLKHDMANRVTQHVKFYNSRSCQLILGAGALETAGLKSITARHMAICSQALAAIECMLPTLRRKLLRGIPTLQTSGPSSMFDTTCQDVVLHRQQIQTKLVAIMRERLTKALRLFPSLSTSWNQTSTQVDAVSPGFSLFQQMIKQLETLKNVLTPIMSSSQLDDIFGRIARMYSDSLARALRSLEPSGALWVETAITEVESMLLCLSSLPADDLQQHILALAAFKQQLMEIEITVEPDTSPTHAPTTPTTPDRAPSQDQPPDSPDTLSRSIPAQGQTEDMQTYPTPATSTEHHRFTDPLMGLNTVTPVYRPSSLLTPVVEDGDYGSAETAKNGPVPYDSSADTREALDTVPPNEGRNPVPMDTDELTGGAEPWSHCPPVAGTTLPGISHLVGRPGCLNEVECPAVGSSAELMSDLGSFDHPDAAESELVAGRLGVAAAEDEVCDNKFSKQVRLTLDPIDNGEGVGVSVGMEEVPLD